MIRYIYMFRRKGEEGYVCWNDAKIHVLSHVIHYSSAVFEGIRGYITEGGVAIFRGDAHYRRLINSAKIYRMFAKDYLPDLVETTQGVEYVPMNKAIAYFMDITKKLIKKNDLYQMALRVRGRDMQNPFVYIRPVIYRGYESKKEDPILGAPLGVNPLNNPVEWFIATFLWDDYLGTTAIKRGADVITSAWAKNAPSTTPFMAKAASNYATGQLAKMEAVLSAYFKDPSAVEKARNAVPPKPGDILFPVESVQLTPEGYVAEGTGENVFVVFYKNDDPRRVVIYTPPIYSSILPGITRDSIITLIKDLRGFASDGSLKRAIDHYRNHPDTSTIPHERIDEVENLLNGLEEVELVETMIPREMLYIADEVFFVGTAAEVTPIRTVDGIPVGKGIPGPITLLLRLIYTSIALGKVKDRYGWVEYVEV